MMRTVELMDRKKDMIISGGFNIYPSDLEAVMRQHPGVADVAVVQRTPSEDWGETPVAFVVSRGADASGAERAFANARVGKNTAHQRYAADPAGCRAVTSARLF